MMLKAQCSARVAAPRSRATTVVVRAESTDRRSLLGLAAAAVGAVLVPKAEAIVIPSQESTGGMVKGKGSIPKSSTAASMEGYTLEGYPGTKKPSFIEPGKKRKLRAKARENALKEAGQK